MNNANVNNDRTNNEVAPLPGELVVGIPVHGRSHWFGRRTHCSVYVVGATDGSSHGIGRHWRHGHRPDCLAVSCRLQARRSGALLRKYRCVTYENTCYHREKTKERKRLFTDSNGANFANGFWNIIDKSSNPGMVIIRMITCWTTIKLRTSLSTACRSMRGWQ